jgi:Zn-dependent protease with chaperone function
MIAETLALVLMTVAGFFAALGAVVTLTNSSGTPHELGRRAERMVLLDFILSVVLMTVFPSIAWLILTFFTMKFVGLVLVDWRHLRENWNEHKRNMSED